MGIFRTEELKSKLTVIGNEMSVKTSIFANVICKIKQI